MSNDDEADKLKLNNDGMICKKSWRKRKKDIQRKLIDTLYESNINILILFLKNMSHQKIYTSWYCVVNDEI